MPVTLGYISGSIWGSEPKRSVEAASIGKAARHGSRPGLRGALTRWINTQGLSVYTIAAGFLLLSPWSGVGLDYLSMDRAALGNGEFWRVWTGPLVHNSLPHLLLSLTGLVVLQQMFGEELQAVFWAPAYAVISTVIGVCWLLFDEVSWLPYGGYDSVVGLSAILHGLFAYAACLAMRRDRLLASGVLLIIGIKIVWEHLFGPSELSAGIIDMPVAATTHVYGYAGGLGLGAIATLTRRMIRAGR